jgi:hypothetical protein
VLWIDPQAIQFKISPTSDLAETAGGDWDLERRFPLIDAVKHQAIAQRYRDGTAWEETRLFRETYSARFAKGGNVRGCATMQALIEQYYGRVDGMFVDMRRRGFVASEGPLPTFLIGRTGEVFIANQGNHRLAMAQILGLKRIAGRIICTHASLSRQ